MLDQPLRIIGLNVKRATELEKKVDKFDSTLAQLSKSAYNLSDAIRNYAEQLNALTQAEKNHIHELDAQHKKVQERTREIEEKLHNQTLEIGSTGKMKFLDQQIDRFKMELDELKLTRKHVEKSICTAKKELCEIQRENNALKNNKKLLWYKNLCPVKWIDWKESVGQPGITVVGEFMAPTFEQDKFTLVVACSENCSSRKVVENVDWVWNELHEILCTKTF